MTNILELDVQYQKLENNQTIAYLEKGTGKKTLIFIHGLGNSMIGWSKNIDELSPYFKCIAIDLPGNGFSSKNHFPYSITNFTRSIFQFIQAKKIEHCTIVGHSMGGQIAIQLAHQFPHIVQSLILIAPAGIETFNFWEKNMMTQGMHLIDMSLSDESKLFQALKSSFYLFNKENEIISNAMVKLLEMQPPFHYKKMVNQCIQSMLDENVQNSISNLNCPCLVIFGTMDAMIPNKLFHPITTTQLAKNGIKKFKDRELMLIPYAGHFVHWEKSNLVNKKIIEFLNA